MRAEFNKNSNGFLMIISWLWKSNSKAFPGQYLHFGLRLGLGFPCYPQPSHSFPEYLRRSALSTLVASIEFLYLARLLLCSVLLCFALLLPLHRSDSASCFVKCKFLADLEHTFDCFAPSLSPAVHPSLSVGSHTFFAPASCRLPPAPAPVPELTYLLIPISPDCECRIRDWL